MQFTNKHFLSTFNIAFTIKNFNLFKIMFQLLFKIDIQHWFRGIF